MGPAAVLVAQRADLAVVEKVDAMYSRSLNTMMLYLSILVVIIAVAIPVITAFYQRKRFEAEEAKLRQLVADEVDGLREDNESAIESLMKTERSRIEAALGDLRKDVRQRGARATAGVFQLQARLNSERGDHRQALWDEVTAARSWLQAGDNTNIQTVLNVITNSYLPRVTKDDIDSFRDLSQRLDDLFERLEKADDDGRFALYIERLKDAVAALEKK